MKRQSLLRVLAITLLTLLPTGTSFAADNQDKLVGSGQLDPTSFRKTQSTVSAHSGPEDEDPHGQVLFAYLNRRIKGEVSCLNIQGNTVLAVARLDEPFHQLLGATYSDIWLLVIDNGAPGQFPDELELSIRTGFGSLPPPVTSCYNEGFFIPISKGNFVVTDATP